VESCGVAARAGDAEMMAKALKDGADINGKAERGLTPLMLAATSCSKHAGSRGTIGALELLLASRADMGLTDDQGWTVVHHASRSGRQEIVDLLLRGGAALRSKSKKKTLVTIDKKTPLILAAQDGNEEVMKSLIAERASVDTQDEDGWSALCHAIEALNMDIIGLLLKSGADPNMLMEDGSTPLLMATSMGILEVAEALIRYDADINVTDRHGDSPLMLSLKDRNGVLVDLFMHKKADLDTVNLDGEGAIDISFRTHMIAVHRLIRKRMGITMLSSSCKKSLFK